MNQIHALRIGLVIACIAAGLQLPLSCSGSALKPPSSTTAVELCAQGMALDPDLQAQAAKLEREPLDFTRQICGAVMLAAQVVQANLPRDITIAAAGAAGVASAPSSEATAGSSQ